MTLPPLPEPDTHCFDDDKQQDVWSYSKAQLLALQAATVEACAESVKALERNGAWVTKEEVLNAIRSMK